MITIYKKITIKVNKMLNSINKIILIFVLTSSMSMKLPPPMHNSTCTQPGKSAFGQKSNPFRQKTRFLTHLIKKSSAPPVKKKARTLARLIIKESIKAKQEPIFVASLIKSESTFNPGSTSNMGAQGLMQLMPSTAEYISVKNSVYFDRKRLKEPKYNLRLGLAYLSHLKAKFDGNTEHALIAYNWGPGNLNKALREQGHIPSETKKYAQKIIKNHKAWKSDFALTKQKSSKVLG